LLRQPSGGASSRSHGRFAASLIRCHDTTGAKLTLSAGDPIPDEADLTGVSRDAIEER
jgi:hypothetical protein